LRQRLNRAAACPPHGCPAPGAAGLRLPRPAGLPVHPAASHRTPSRRLPGRRSAPARPRPAARAPGPRDAGVMAPRWRRPRSGRIATRRLGSRMTDDIDRTDELLDMQREDARAEALRDGSLLADMFNGTWLDAQHFPPLEYAVPGIIPEGFGVLV